MKAIVAVLALAACTPREPQKPKPIVTPIVHREKPPGPNPVDPMPVQPQGKLADPPTDAPNIPPLNPGTNGDQPAAEPPK
jgi:hypothetical protein